ncbi:MAG: hypothetical protein ACOX8E_00375 [Ruminococcus sp.]|jgi:hypothetical protein
MREKDILTAVYLKRKSRFADLINVHCFGGKPVIRPEDIQEEDSMEFRVRKGGKIGKAETKKEYRDAVRKVACGTQFVVICLEEQSYVDYTMPVRVMNYDAQRYEQQVLLRRQEHREKKDLEGAGYLSGISPEDRFLPVITLILYFGRQWDGARSLKELLDIDGLSPEMQDLIADYPLYVIEVGNYPHTGRFQTDLKMVFGFFQNADDKEKMLRFIEKEKESLAMLPEDAFDLISVMSNTKELDRIKEESRKGKERIDMCKAIDDMIADAKEEGRREMMSGLKEMVEDAKEEGRREMMSGLKEMVEDAKEEGRREMMSGLKEMVEDAKEEGRREMMSGLKEMVEDAKEEGRREMMSGLKEMVEDAKEEGRREMMSGLKEMVEDAKEEGRREMMSGLKEMVEDAKEEGKDEMLRNLIRKKMDKGLQKEEIAALLEIDPETVQRSMESA